MNALKQGKKVRFSDPAQFPESRLLGDLPVNVPETARRAGGISGINAKTCPVLVLHGDSDQVVNYEQSEMYYEAMMKAGRDITYYVLNGADHGSDEFFQEEVRSIILEYLDRKLAGK